MNERDKEIKRYRRERFFESMMKPAGAIVLCIGLVIGFGFATIFPDASLTWIIVGKALFAFLGTIGLFFFIEG